MMNFRSSLVRENLLSALAAPTILQGVSRPSGLRLYGMVSGVNFLLVVAHTAQQQHPFQTSEHHKRDSISYYI